MFHFKHEAGDVKSISAISSAFLLMRPSESESHWFHKVSLKGESKKESGTSSSEKRDSL